MTNTKERFRVVVRDRETGRLISATNTMPLGRAMSIERKMLTGEQYDPVSETLATEKASVDNDPADAVEGWA